MIDKGTTRARLLAVLAAAAVFAAACTTGSGTSTAPSAAAPSAAASEAAPSEAAPSAAAQYKIGYSNGGGVGNGFREEQVCTAKAEALASGEVSELTVIHRDTDGRRASSSDMRDLIAKDVDAIVFNPNDPAALNPALDEAKAAGIKTVSVDAYVTDPDTYNLYNNQVNYAYLGAKWLFEQMGGKGNVYYSRGFAGHPADTDRDVGLQEGARRVRPTSRSSRPPMASTPAGIRPRPRENINNWISSGQYDDIQGIWTSGMDSMVVDAIKASGKPYVPIVGADLGAFVEAAPRRYELSGPEGRGRHEHRRRRRRWRRTWRSSSSTASPSRRTRRPPRRTPSSWMPVLADNQSDEGKATLESWQSVGARPDLAARSPIEGWTTYTPEQAVACKGPERAERSSAPASRLAGGAGIAGIPCPPSAPTGSDDPHDHGSPARGLGHRQDVRRGRRAASQHRWPCVPARSTRSWARTAPARARSSRS